MKNKKFEFAKQIKYFKNIEPIKKHMPDWYKNAEAFHNGNIKRDNESGLIKKNFKNCMPFLDSMTFGYSIDLPFDINVVGEKNKKTVFWEMGTVPIILTRDLDQNPTLPIPAGCSNQHFVWNNLYYFRLPKGYSMMFTHPLNRFDLPFTTLSGIIDSDSVVGTGSIPFFINNDFEGVIEAGTPIIQLIPFKRDNWKSEFNEKVASLGEYGHYLSETKNFGFYKNNFWKKKKFD